MKNAASMRRSVRQRVSERCEYYDLAQSSFPLVSFHVEHVVAKQHGGSEQQYGDAAHCFGRTDERPRRGFKASNFDHGS